MECWVKTGITGSGVDETLIGKVNSSGGSPDYALQLLASRHLQADVYDTTGKVWRTTVPLTAYEPSSRSWSVCLIDDNQWHLLSMVVDRTVGALQIFVDGSLKGSSAPPAGFGNVRNSQLFRAGLGYGYWWTFPGIIDEVRVLKAARSADEIRADFGIPPAGPSLAPASSVTNTLGNGNSPFAAAEPGVSSEEDPRTIEGQTVLLWHLDELDDGVVRIEGEADTEPSPIGGSSGPDSLSQAGRWEGGRSGAAITADPDDGVLDFGGSSFTVNFWVKTDPVGRTYTLVGRPGPSGQLNDFSVSISPTGSLTAWLCDSTGHLWSVRTTRTVDTGEWTMVTMVVDRISGWLSLYIDGEESSAELCPEAFGAVRNSGEPLRAGWVDPWGPSSFGGPSAFPGVLDEICIQRGAGVQQ